MFADLNLKYHYDESLYEVLDSVNDFKVGIALLQEKLSALESASTSAASEKNTEQSIEILATLGSYQRMLGLLKDAEASQLLALECIQKITDKNNLRFIAARLRLAQVYQFQKNFAKSNALFTECLKAAKESAKESKDQKIFSFALQHQGKNLFDQGLFARALAAFYRALEIRRGLIKLETTKSNVADSQTSAAELVDSSLFALRACEKKLFQEQPVTSSPIETREDLLAKVTVSWAQTTDFAKAQAFYQSVGYLQKISEDSLVVTASDIRPYIRTTSQKKDELCLFMHSP